MNKAAGGGHVEVVRFFHEHTDVQCTTDAMDYTAAYGHLDVVKFLYEHRSEGCTTRAMDRSAERGYLEVVQFLHQNRTEGCTSEAMNGVGSLEVVRFLHEHRTEGCTTDAMDSAAALGHPDIVRFLHEHRTEGCTTNAMDEAAAEGHLDVVRFLHEHRSEGCTTGAMGEAAERGHLEIVQFLHANRTERCEQSHLMHLLMIGAFDAWLGLQEKFPGNDSAKEAMKEAGTDLVLPTIRFLCEKMGRYDLFPHAFEYIRHECVEWIHALSPFIQACDKKRDIIEQLVGQADDAEHNHIQYAVALCGKEVRGFAIRQARREQKEAIVWSLERWEAYPSEFCCFMSCPINLPHVPD
ncbi:hypothetical protein Poli38472_001452 [Pythium oligandrum]|uniref:Ankyrin repeat protein n=1 Tax=Pythium oligandrum TaxID=41045 RepID=A0A8K1CVB7_PYTOL|nr:hypothetical protein Poli38472_001452 [Pythium oligandrum]|eukprot:TMW69296.1 hypothetical protein Poli38472_001452 [Pythium oligandrum]